MKNFTAVRKHVRLGVSKGAFKKINKINAWKLVSLLARTCALLEVLVGDLDIKKLDSLLKNKFEIKLPGNGF